MPSFRESSHRRGRAVSRLAALVALAIASAASLAAAQNVPFREEIPSAPVCRTVLYDPSATIQLEILTGHPAPNGLSFHVSAVNSDGGFGTVRVVGAHGESEFGNDQRDSGRMYSLYGSVRPGEGGQQCYEIAFDVTVHVPGGGTRRLFGSTVVKTMKPMPRR